VRKLDEAERKSYIGDFWETSNRLKAWDQRAKDQKELHDLDAQLKRATIANLEAQPSGEPAPLKKLAEISTQRRKLEQQLQSDATAQIIPLPARVGKRSQRPRRPPFRLRES
jgi:hypothetical protein